jgi:trehalose 6-phosphate phosphatase
VLKAALRLRGARLLHGKEVVNVVHPGAANKGAAVVEVRRDLGCDRVLYFGDDVTDEDVFRLDQPGRLFTIRIGRSKTSAARYYLRQQQEIDTLLEHLVALRVEPRPAAARRRGASS